MAAKKTEKKIDIEPQKDSQAAPTFKNENAVTFVLLAVILGIMVVGGLFFLQSQSDPTSASPEDAVAEVTTTSEETLETPDSSAVVPTKILVVTGAQATAQTAEAPVSNMPAHTEGVDTNLAGQLPVIGLGDKNAPLVIAEYTSLTCNHCAFFHEKTLPLLKSEFIDTGKVYYELREFPLNQPALEATMILRCLPEEKYVDFQDMLFKTQKDWAFSEKYRDVLKQKSALAGLTGEAFETCLADESLKTKIAADVKKANEVHTIRSTPTFVINNGQEVIVGNLEPQEFVNRVREILQQIEPSAETQPAP